MKIRSQLTILSNRYQSFVNAETIVLKDHQEICKAVAAKDTGMALALMEKHVEHAKNYLLSTIKSRELYRVYEKICLSPISKAYPAMLMNRIGF